jgi:ABC-type nitrate/sulfonate/bicarbonate transport system permease component
LGVTEAARLSQAHSLRFAAPSIGRLLGLALIAVLIIAWELSVRLHWVVSDSWPSLSSVLLAGLSAIVSGELLIVLGSTIARAGAGYACGILAGAVLGLLFAISSSVRRLLSPVVELLRRFQFPPWCLRSFCCSV